MVKIGRWFTGALALFAILNCAALLAIGAFPLFTAASSGVPIGHIRRSVTDLISLFAAGALILAGVAFIGVQAFMRPSPIELLKRMMVAMAFVLWGVTALMPPGALTTELGNIVIALYVIDLGLVIRGDLKRNAGAGD